MKKICLILFASIISTAVMAQTIPVLPKEWKGEVSGTSYGTTNPLNPRHPDNVGEANSPKELNTFDEARTLTIIQQEGRHLELLIKGPKYESRWVGTISKDGRQIQIAVRGGEFLLNLSGNTLSGCGTARGTLGIFEHWLNNYISLCYDFTAAK